MHPDSVKCWRAPDEKFLGGRKKTRGRVRNWLFEGGGRTSRCPSARVDMPGEIVEPFWVRADLLKQVVIAVTLAVLTQTLVISGEIHGPISTPTAACIALCEASM